jgi:Skp family chaperone for outer membrane proteins
MKTLLASAALAASILLPTAANGQAVPAAVIAVVDLQKVMTDCNACKNATAALRTQITTLENREKTLGTSIQTEQKSIQAAIDALPKGTEPSAALQARAQAWDQKRQQAAQEITDKQQQIQRNNQYIQKQILDKLAPIYTQVMQKRGANILIETSSTLATSSSVDVTNDVLAALNPVLPSLVTIAPTQAQPQPQGR